jgi:hypothetical protein
VSEPTDEELMERFIDGDAVAFDALFSRHAATVRAYLQRMTGSMATNAARDLGRRSKLESVIDEGVVPDTQRQNPQLRDPALEKAVKNALVAAAGGTLALHFHCPTGTLAHMLLFHLAPALAGLAVLVRRVVRPRSFVP